MSTTHAYVGLGANLGDPVAALRMAARRLAVLPIGSPICASSVYVSAPVDADGPDFYNAVVAFNTTLPPEQLLDHLLAIEQAHGRERPFRNAPRTLDLDLLLYGDLQLHTDRLTLPHPRMHQRAFVLAPLADLAPDLVIPVHGSVATLLARVVDQRISRTSESLI